MATATQASAGTQNPAQVGEKWITFRIWRQESATRPGGFEEFRVPHRKGANVISCLMQIQRNPVNAAGKTTMARWTPQGSDISYEDIPTPVLDPEPRWYA